MKSVRSAQDRSTAIAELAYRLWEERGCPQGSPEEDWYQAELLIDREEIVHDGNAGALRGKASSTEDEAR